MLLVDTSVWVNHLRAGLPQLETALIQGKVLMHPLVLGELACGNLKDRESLLKLLSNLPAAPRASDAEVLVFIDAHQLMGRGIGLIDVHLLASAALEADAQLWSHDKRLAQQAARLGLAFSASVN
ncbi:MAG: VapC toxin family PIN domain ribonuclease [Xanthomonadales bacterium]|nr:VapC toxin family PIN domain ribonuclease [Xanthomonadales bacterium]